MSRPASRRTFLGAVIASLGLAVTGLAGPGLAATPSPAPASARCQALNVPTSPVSGQRQAAFTAAARQYGVPVTVLLGVAFLESRWDEHQGLPSTAGGYGPFNLTDVSLPDLGRAKGDGSTLSLPEPADLRTLRLAARLTGLAPTRLRTDPAANICGGAALLAHYQQQLGSATGIASRPAAWYAATGRYSGSSDQASARRFAGMVFGVLRSGARRTTDDGQRVRLAAHPRIRPNPASIKRLGLTVGRAGTRPVECPAALGCVARPAPYRWYGAPRPTRYGNHDLAHRPSDMRIDYIVIHDSEATWPTMLSLVTDPRYVSWQYSVRSSDGQVAQHVWSPDVAWQAGNWYVNMHAIGIEHEGFEASGATWYTEAMYRNSAALVRYLAARFHIPLDRAHIIGHDQVPGIAPAYVAGMHTDPGPYWDWQHYLRLVGAQIRPTGRKGSPIVTLRPGFAGNRQLVTGCRGGGACPAQGTNFVYLHTRPSRRSPLVSDIGIHRDGRPSTTAISDIGARATAGMRFVVARRHGAWCGVWYLGQLAWFRNPLNARVTVPASGSTVSLAAGETSAPIYGRAYPRPGAYPAAIPAQPVIRLRYTIKPGQSYVLADPNIQTDYYYARTYNNSVPDDHTDVSGGPRYYEIWFGHRLGYVRASTVVVKRVS